MNYARYKKLYRRFLQRSPDELLNLAGTPRGRVLDLCTGGGRLAKAALARGFEDIVVVDQDAEMMENIDSRITRINLSVMTALDSLASVMFDLVFCQQAINYWFHPGTIEDLHRVMCPEGVFVFNTFNTCPKSLSTHSYSMEGNRYIEVSWMVGDRVHHVQIMDGERADQQDFQWISPAMFNKMLDPYFDVEPFVKGRTTIYRCTRRNS